MKAYLKFDLPKCARVHMVKDKTENTNGFDNNYRRQNDRLHVALKDVWSQMTWYFWRGAFKDDRKQEKSLQKANTQVFREYRMPLMTRTKETEMNVSVFPS